MTMSAPLIRALRVEDAADCHAIRTQPQVIWGTLQLPTLSMEDVRAQLAAVPDGHRLGAEVDGKIVATCDLWVGGGMERHTGYLGIAVHDAYQGLGFGKELMAAQLDLADKGLMLNRVALDVYLDNERAVRMYRSFGFLDEGVTRKDAMRDGTLVDLLHMGRLHPVLPHRPPAATPATPPSAGTRVLDGPKIRGARPEDVSFLLRILRQPAVQAALGRFPTHHDDDVRREYSPLPRGHHLFVAEAAGEVIGLAHLKQFGGRRSHVGKINTVAVDQAWQGRGVGSALLQAVVALGERWLGLKRLQARVMAPDAPALRLFQRHGFTPQVTQREAFFREGRFVDAFILGRST
ncbi:MAG TPA: GNAT family N-acetyltransferase [Symbiobacteriaceae bacterium]|nr:GNAT family N-acetyltransferase [Symbiobacteriaceae bacterium]